MSDIDFPESCETPLHTCEALEQSIAQHAHEGLGGAEFVSVDVRVLRWLIADARTLNLLISAKLAA